MLCLFCVAIGTRYKRRGVDERGCCANYVETEQVRWLLPSGSHKSKSYPDSSMSRCNSNSPPVQIPIYKQSAPGGHVFRWIHQMSSYDPEDAVITPVVRHLVLEVVNYS